MKAIVLSEIFPPTIGGSGELLRQIYARFQGVPVTVVADVADGVPARATDAVLTIVRHPMQCAAWGLASRAGLAHHVREARLILTMGRRADAVVHVARALPEGVGAWLASLIGGPHYCCWAHGEDVASAGTSRELSWLMRRVFGRAQVVLANSHNTARLVAAVGVPASKIHVIHPGVDAARFAGVDATRARALRARLAGPDESIILAVGRLQRRKGHDVTLQALAQLRAEGRAVRFVIVGDGEERSRLVELAAALQVTGAVTFAGVASADELPVYYAVADVFCHPNRIDGHDVEGFGIVFLEAAAASLPVIGGDSGGAPEAIERDVTGLLVSGTDAGQLRAAIAALLDAPERRRAMGEAGRARVAAAFSWERAAAAAQAVHERIQP